MRIEPTGFYYHYASQRKNEQEVSTTETSKASIHQEDMSALHKGAKEMKNLIQHMHYEEIIREDKIREIKEKMDAGTYLVSGKDVVSKLMGER